MSLKNSDQVPVANIPGSERIASLSNLFFEEFNREPDFIVRVPGRVNIIGEHIDYCGYPVLPMALEQDILIAAGLLPNLCLQLRNSVGKYVKYDTDLKDHDELVIQPDENGKPFWYNYVLCGVKGALEYLDNKIVNGLQLYVDGNILPASGLSSSSALVSAACLAILHAQNVELNKKEIANLCANSERYIGTQGGGMDQAIAFLAEKHSAQYITFRPKLNATSVALPEDAAFVVAHSLAEANKAATNDFNQRVIECRLAAKILITSAGVTNDKEIITLSEVQNMLQNDLDDMIDLVHKYLPKDLYDKEEICHILDIGVDDLDRLFLTQNTKHLKEFKLKQRALHVYQEAKRVEEFRKFCVRANSNGVTHTNGSQNTDACKNGGDKSNQALETLGELMSASHESLRNLYECSHVNLDILVDLSKELNVNSRLTGAGWGGCIVALCSKDNVESYIETLKEEFYRKRFNIEKEESEKYVFATTPNFGAIIYKNTK